MSDPFRDQPFPRGALIGAALLIGFSLLAVSLGRIAGLGRSTEAPPTALYSRQLRFEDRPDGAILVYNGQGERVIDVVEPGTGGFVRGVLRALARERRTTGEAETGEPFLLSRRADGRVTLEDPATGRFIDLKAFGPTNEAAFTRLLEAEGP